MPSLPAQSRRPSISPPEEQLLWLARSLFSDVPAPVLQSVLQSWEQPLETLSPAAAALLERTVQRGAALCLARSGGWRNETWLRGERGTTGRLWERTPPEKLALSFSGATWQLFQRLLLRADQPAPLTASLTVGDRWLAWHVAERVRTTTAFDLLQQERPHWSDGLWRLWFADAAVDFTSPLPAELDVQRWLTPPGSWIIEVLTPHITLRIQQLVQQLLRTRNVVDFVRINETLQSVAQPWLESAWQVHRPDLARWALPVARNAGPSLVEQARELLRGGSRIAADQVSRDRVLQAAQVIPDWGSLFVRWTEQARKVGYLDENYSTAQFWLKLWEQSGPR